MAFSLSVLKSIRWVLTAGIVVLVVVGVVVGRGGEKAVIFSSSLVERKDIVQSVSETGSVVSSLEVRYGWEISGRVVDILKNVGDEVKKGDIIARLDSGKATARLNEAYASLRSAEAKLNLELAGPSKESIESSSASVRKAEANVSKVRSIGEGSIDAAKKALETAQNNIQRAEGGEDSQIVNDAYEDLINTIHAGVTDLSEALTESDNILGIDNTNANDDFESALGSLDLLTKAKAEESYKQARSTKRDAENTSISLSALSVHEDVDSAARVLDNALSTMTIHLLDVQRMLDKTRSITVLSQAELNVLKVNITTVKTSINAASTNLTNQTQAVTTARNSLTSYEIAHDTALLGLTNEQKTAKANNDLAVADLDAAKAKHEDLIAPAREVDLASFRADVSRQAANVAALRDDVEKSVLTALVDGVIGKLDVKMGENISTNQKVLTVLSPQFSVEVDISESDIAKVAVGDVVDITLDAFGEHVHFAGNVIHIEPADTEISGVIYYKTDISLDPVVNVEIRSGMTANINIETNKKERVLLIPRRAVLRKEGKELVRVVIGKEKGIFEEREVVTGISGDDGLVEIVEGLKEGEEVVTFVEE
jgi:multidrug efflux pump subunit AcrA (membrane-fusion protein)